MFPRRYYCGTMFAARFFPESQGQSPIVVTPRGGGSSKQWHAPRNPFVRKERKKKRKRRDAETLLALLMLDEE